ncbi:DUF2194 domain-containing protein [Anaerobium acetethylicum]|uniref:DUF2194 domain-containing protein n=1 Tax=Anaerobium acetethylicum TaxID=1619234 RepID=A0A1D3TWQ9_9FIRM|nr:DUF2194 domain-containing protein [Anaerobium acetethylicum]SCP98698.1 hypothetical protein SAMN05421730_102437 [Anaerobium acetethylicum]
MKTNSFKIIWSLLALAICGLVLLAERKGIAGGEKQDIQSVKTEMEETTVYSGAVDAGKDCLLIMDSAVETSVVFEESMSYILESLSVGYDVVDLEKETLPELGPYQTVVLAVSDLSHLKEDIVKISDWVKNGGRLMNTDTYEPNSYFQILSGKMGISEGGNGFTTVSKIHVEDGFMIGGGRDFDFGESTGYAIVVQLDDECKVLVDSADSGVPLLWEREYGEGRFVVMNMGETGKINRGFLTAAYSLLQDAFAYPVINASAYYIDDFPAPVPDGQNEYITKDYQTSIKDFYMNIWLPTVLEWEEKYGIVHTGMIVETYSDRVKGPFEEQAESEKFELYGNLLLNNGGELGLHGYNHMPLCMEGFNYLGLYDGYRLWPDEDEMKASLEELLRFSQELFPYEKFSVYVPPSNILSEEGRKMIADYFPDITTISSVYLPSAGGCEYIQEFGVGEDGLIDTPRIVSGCIIDSYMELAAFSELNFHYVQSHFLHQDDALDAERGADLGWEELSRRFEDYLGWIGDSAPDIRNVTGSQMGQAVEQYDKLSVKQSYGDRELHIELGGFSKEAYLMLRLNQGRIGTIDGGEYEHIEGNLYLIHALQDEVTITW